MLTTQRQAKGSKGLPEIIKDQLRADIQKGTLAAGTQLRQDALAERFQTSRLPVREALRQLEAEGLVIHQRNRGTVVAGMTIAQICELLDIRIALECYAAKIGVPNMVQRDFDAMRNVLVQYDASTSVAEWAEYNRHFHLALSAAANNTRLRRLIEEFCLNTDRYTHELISEATGKENPQKDHYEILDACQRRDAGEVARLLELHIQQTKNNLLATERLKIDLAQETDSGKRRFSTVLNAERV